jgi:hypothetical protein
MSATNTELLQSRPGGATSAISTTVPVAFDLMKGGKVTATSEDTAFRVWFSDPDDSGDIPDVEGPTIPAHAMKYAMGEKPTFDLVGGSSQKRFCLVVAVGEAGNTQLLQE